MEKRDTQKYTFEESDKNAKVKVLPGIEPGLREGSNRTLFSKVPSQNPSS